MAKEDPVHRLEILASSAGKQDSSLLVAVLAGASNAALVKIGRTIDTRRIVVDTARIYEEAWSWWNNATTEQRRIVRGVSKELLALAIHQALALERLRDAREGASAADATSRAALEKEAENAFSAGLALRDQAYTAMRDAAGLDKALRSAVDAAVGTAERGEALARGLAAMAALLGEWLKKKKKDDGLASRIKLASLDDGYVEELATAGKLVQSTATKAEQKAPALKVSQGELDREDGVNVMLLGQILRAFDAAHTRNPTVPRLVPISTRRLFNRTKKKAEDVGETHETDKADGTKSDES